MSTPIKAQKPHKPLISAQIRAARALIRWRAHDLARESAVGIATIRRAELTEAQTSMTAANNLAVRRALEAAGASLTDVVSVIVYLADIDDWGRFNTAYKQLMPTPYPTRTALGASLRGILVEISAVAYVGI